MRADRETVGRGADGEPRVKIAVGELYHPVAFLADEMVVVAAAAQAVTDLAGMVHERVDHASFAERGEGAVDGREADGLAGGAQRRMDLLGSCIVLLCRKRAEYREPLPRRPEAVVAQ